MVEGRIERRLAAILAADVVGYSRLMGEDEEGTLATLKAYRRVIDELIQTHDGRVFGGAGDSVIAEFASPVEAVRCATEIQLELDKRSADVPDERQVPGLGIQRPDCLGNPLRQYLNEIQGVKGSADADRPLAGFLDLSRRVRWRG